MSVVEITRILHAGYIFRHQGTSILFDPLFENPFSENCYAYPDIKFDLEQIATLRFSAIFISHYHDDHCSFESLNLLDKKTPIYIYCLDSELIELIKELGFHFVFSLKLDESVFVDDFKVIARRALDADVDSMFHVQLGNLNILNVVDSWIDYATVDFLSSNFSWDLILWPFQTMLEVDVLSPLRALPADRHLPIEWLEQIKQLNPKYIVPSSCQFTHEDWSWLKDRYFPITYKQFEEDVKKYLPEAQAIRLEPGRQVILDKSKLSVSGWVSWIEHKSSSEIDYHFNQSQKPQTTALVTSYILADMKKRQQFFLEEDKRKVIRYCEKELVETFNCFDFFDEHYFFRNGIWRLQLFDENDTVYVFKYKVDKNKIHFISRDVNLDKDCGGELIWTTDLPMVKLFNALYKGESLSSLYIRINDQFFSDEIEEKLKDIDVLIDPLLTCVYSQKFSYQKAQLERIKLERNKKGNSL